MIDSIQDPQNFGSILRTCDAFGVKTVIYKKDNQVQVNDFVIKTSMGAISNLNLIRVTNLSNALNQLKKSGY
jgi:23S rRNA (guanosine2251-2'-O)-methyltransferase